MSLVEITAGTGAPDVVEPDVFEFSQLSVRERLVPSQ